MNIQDMTSMGMQFGIGLAVIPAVAIGSIAALSLIVNLANNLFLRYQSTHP